MWYKQTWISLQSYLQHLLSETKRKILSNLQGGPKTISQLAETLNMNRTAVEGHLDALQSEGIVEYHFEKSGLGRPKKYYSLTTAGYETFPRKYGLLLNMLVEKLIELYGLENAKKVLLSVARELAKQVPSIAQISDIKERTYALVKILNDLGFDATLQQEKGKLVIIRKNCIWHEVASKYPNLTCEVFDNEFLKTCLGGTDTELRGCIAKGDSCCENLVLKKFKQPMRN